MKKTYFVKRDEDGGIIDKGFMIEPSAKDDKATMTTAYYYLMSIYDDETTFVDGVIRVHCNNLHGVDLRVFKSLFNDDYKAMKNYAKTHKDLFADKNDETTNENRGIIEKDENGFSVYCGPVWYVKEKLAVKPVKKVRRRNKQIKKALNLMGKTGKEEKIINSLFHRGGTLAFVA